MQTVEGFFENGLFYSGGKRVALPERQQVVVVFHGRLPRKQERKDTQSVREHLDRLHALLDASADEEINFEDFPRMRFGRDVTDFSDGGEEGEGVSDDLHA